MKHTALLVSVLNLLLATGRESCGDVAVELSAGEHDCLVATPIVVPLPPSVRTEQALVLVNWKTKNSVPLQLLAEHNNAIFLLDESLPAGATRKYNIRPASLTGSERSKVTVDDTGRSLVLRVGGKTVLKYHHATVESPDGIETLYRRSGYIHPLKTPSGREVTDDFPPDHPHQHGVVFAWVNTTFGEQEVDFWNQKAQTGLVEHIAVDNLVHGPVFGEFQVRLHHQATNDANPPIKVLKESWIVRAYNVHAFHLIDMWLSQECLDSPLKINQFHYGGFAFRENRQWFHNDDANNSPEGKFAFVTNKTRNRIAGNHTRPRWVSLTGPVDGQPVSVTVIGHSTNYRYPQPVRLHPRKPYFCFAPMVLGAFQLEKAHPYQSRYRFYVHDGPVDSIVNNTVWKNYVESPKVRVLAQSIDN